MSLMASDIKLLNPLKEQFGQYGQKAQGSLTDALGRLTGQAKISAMASNRPIGEYQNYALGQANTLASRGINDSLASILGGASLKEMRSQREHAQNMELARKYGQLMSPSTGQEIAGGLGQLANLGLTGYGLYNSLGKSAPWRSDIPYGVV